MSDATTDWDRDLSREGVSLLQPKLRGLRIKTALERKVSVVEEAALVAVGGQISPHIPTTRAALRRWKDPERGLWDWVWPLLDAFDGPNADLMARYKTALASLRRARSRRLSGTADELAERDRMIDRLRRQNAQLVEQIRALQGPRADPPLRRR